MTDDLDFQESLDRYFEIEAAELLQTIEQTLFQLVEEKTIERVHTLMRSAHTIKGSAANCGFKTIETIAHHLEDVFQALYPAELEIDPQLGLLLLEGYECLSDPLSAMLAGMPYDEAATLERTAELFARLQEHLGDFFGRETPLPTAAELGFDVVGSIFTDSVPQDLEVLAEAVASQNVERVRESLTSLSEFLLELGGSYSLPGIVAISTTTAIALERHPEKVLDIAQVALTNFQQAQIAILGGDRSVGGQVSPELTAWAGIQSESNTDRSVDPNELAEWQSLVNFDDLDSESPNIDSQGSSEWLSLIDTDNIGFAIATEDDDVATQNIDSQASSEWLSLIDTDNTKATVAADESAESETIVDDSPTSDWLSLIDTEQIETVADRLAIDHILDIDPEVIELGFDSEAADFHPAEQDRIEHQSGSALITRTNSELAVSNISGIDRIFQSISIAQPELAAEDSQQLEGNAAPKREAAPESLISVRVATVQLERLSHTIGELLIDDNQQYLRTDRLAGLAKATVEQYRRCEQKLRLVGDWADKNTLAGERTRLSSRRSMTPSKKEQKMVNEAQSQFDSLELDVYSDLSILLQNLTDDLAELGIAVNNLAEMTQQTKLKLGKRKQLLAEAQSELFDARMVEVSTVLNRFPRLLQQMVASHRKPAQLELIGSTVLIDKTIADKLYDPLLHLVRNAYDHGVESPETRSMQGKPETGTLTIAVFRQGNRTVIEVSDDGQGLNWAKIRQRAIDMQLLPANRADSATETELSEIMFAPGFSTAEKVNDLSGRGIGLDVVRDRIGALQGTIDVRSVPGKGTTFAMQFPLDLSTARLLICESQGVIHALRSESIGQVSIPSPDKIQIQSSITNTGTSKFLRWGEGPNLKLIPIYPVNNLLTYQCPIIAGEDDHNSLFPVKTKNSASALLMLELDNEQICLEVDRILVEQELVVKSLGRTFGLPKYIQGYSVLGDGSLTLALDPVELLARVRNTSTVANFTPAKMASLQPALQAALSPSSDVVLEGEILDIPEATPTRTTPTPVKSTSGKQLQVLVVDDSLVQRQTLTRSLTKAGCQVIQASHGREGLLRLQEHPRIQLILCDIEMPQMNGFEFLSFCRQDLKLSQIPIVMLTTRSGQKHRQLAMTLGAKDYLTKPQSEKEILDLVAKLSQPSGVGV